MLWSSPARCSLFAAFLLRPGWGSVALCPRDSVVQTLSLAGTQIKIGALAAYIDLALRPKSTPAPCELAQSSPRQDRQPPPRTGSAPAGAHPDLTRVGGAWVVLRKSSNPFTTQRHVKAHVGL